VESLDIAHRHVDILQHAAKVTSAVADVAKPVGDPKCVSKNLSSNHVDHLHPLMSLLSLLSLLLVLVSMLMNWWELVALMCSGVKKAPELDCPQAAIDTP